MSIQDVYTPMKCVSEELGVVHHWFYRDHGKLTLTNEKVSCTMCKALLNLASSQNMTHMGTSPTIHLQSQITGAQAKYESWTVVPSLVSCTWCRAAMSDRVPTHFAKVFEGHPRTVGYEYGLTFCRVTCLVCRYLFLSEKHMEARVTIQEQFKKLVGIFNMVENRAHELHTQGQTLPLWNVDMLCDAIHVTPAGRKLLDALIEQSIMVKKTEDGKALQAVFSIEEAENPDGTPLVAEP